jgi:hypothetical protein
LAALPAVALAKAGIDKVDLKSAESSAFDKVKPKPSYAKASAGKKGD